MTDIKTTLVALVTAIGGLLSHYNIVIPDDFQAAIVAVGAVIFGWLAKDK